MSVKIIQGDVFEVLPTLPDKSVQMCVTSPAYWGLRDYGTATWEGGAAGCEHNPQKADGGDRFDRTLPLGRGGLYREVCSKCGAKRIDAQLGLEKTPEEYVEKLVQVFREVRRVLRDDGTLWLVIGDSYASSSATTGGYSDKSTLQGYTSEHTKGRAMNRDDNHRPKNHGLKPKDLVGIPWRTAFALQADGWYLRSDIIWHKPNPMPESVTDRPTKSHEYIFLLSKNQKYYYDQDAIKEKTDVDRTGDLGKAVRKRNSGGRSDGYTVASGTVGNGVTRNKRTVWTIPTAPYAEAHFATFPPDLIKPCILAGCPQGGTVLDCFAGSGTTGEVAEQLGRNSVLIELNHEYVRLIEKRTAQQGLFCQAHTGRGTPAGDIGEDPQ